MKIVYYYIIILFLFCGCHSKESLREEVLSLYEQGRYWEEAEQADSAAAYYLRSYELAKELKEDSLAGKIGNTLGELLIMHNLFSHANFVFKESYLYNNRQNDKTEASHSLRGIGKSYAFNLSEDSILYRLRLDSTLIYLNKAKSLIPLIKDSIEKCFVYNNLCGVYINYKDYHKALNYNEKAVCWGKGRPEMYKNYSMRADLYFFLQHYDSVIYYCKLAMQSDNLYTQYSGCYQLADALAKLGLADSAIYSKRAYEIHDKIELQKREENIMLLLQKSSQDRLTKRRVIVFFCTTFVLILISCTVLFTYRKYNRKKLLKKDRVIFSQQEELVTEQKQTRNLRNELEESKQIINYAELKEEKQEEEAKNISNIIQLGEECVIRFQKRSFYKDTKKRLNEGASFTKGEREVLFKKVHKCFIPYIKEISKYIQLADEDYFVCCLSLLGFSTKHCAVCRGVGEAAIRVQRKRIKDKLKTFFHSDELCISIFDGKNNNSILGRNFLNRE